MTISYHYLHSAFCFQRCKIKNFSGLSIQKKVNIFSQELNADHLKLNAFFQKQYEKLNRFK